VAVAFGGLALVQRSRANGQRNRADRNAAQARAAQTAAQLAADEALARGLAAQVGSLVATKHNDVALLLAAEAQRFAAQAQAGSGATQEARNALLRVLGTGTTFTGYLDGQVGTTTAISFSPDGKTIASSNDRGQVRVWDAATRRPLPHQPPVALFGQEETLPVSDAGLVATWGGLWDSAAGRMLAWRPPPPDLSSIPSAFPLALSSRQALATSWTPFGSNTSEFNLWDTAAGRRIGARRQIDGIVTALGFSPDGSTLALDIVAPGGATMDLQLLDAHTGALGPRWVAHRARAATPLDPAFTPFFSSVVFSPDGRRVSSVMGASPDGAIATFDTANGAAEPTTGIGKDQNVIAVSPDLAHLIVSTGPCCVAGLPASLIDARTGASSLDLVAPAAPDNGQALAFDPNRPDIVFQHGDGALGVLDWTKPGPSPFATGAAGPPSGPTVTLTPAGSVVDLAAPLRTLGLDSSPNPLSQRIVRQLSGVPASCPATGKPIIDFVGTATTGRVILGCTPKLVFWDLSKPGPGPLWTEPWPGLRFDEPFGPVISPDYTTIADTDAIGTIRLLDARTGAVRARGPTVGADNLLQLSYSPDSHVLAAVHYASDITLLNTSDLSVIQVLHSQLNAADNGAFGLPVVAISPDHAYVAAWHQYGVTEVWDTASGVSLAVLNVQQAGDGPVRASDQPVGSDGRAVTPAVVALLRHDGGPGNAQYQLGALNFSADGTALRFDLLAGYQPPGAPVYHRFSSVRWSMGGDGLVRAACGIVGRDLTIVEWQHYVGSGVPYHQTCSGYLEPVGS
jgi:WD40 repeat protein